MSPGFHLGSRFFEPQPCDGEGIEADAQCYLMRTGPALWPSREVHKSSGHLGTRQVSTEIPVHEVWCKHNHEFHKNGSLQTCPSQACWFRESGAQCHQVQQSPPSPSRRNGPDSFWNHLSQLSNVLQAWDYNTFWVQVEWGLTWPWVKIQIVPPVNIPIQPLKYNVLQAWDYNTFWVQVEWGSTWPWVKIQIVPPVNIPIQPLK